MAMGDGNHSLATAKANWEEIKKLEKKGKIDDDPYIDDAFDESEALIERARKRKAEKRGLKQ